MKRYVLLLVLALTFTALAACTRSTSFPAGTYVDAEIVNVPGKTFDAVILDGHDSGLAPGSPITAVPLCGTDWRAGDRVRILYEGGILETWPMQLNHVLDVMPLKNGQ